MKVRFLHPAIGAFAVHIRPSGVTIIGREGAEADIEITWDRRISRRHAKLFCIDGQLWFEDLGSRNGSWRGNERLTTPLRLAPGSSVLMGETALLVPESQDEDDAREVEQTYEAEVPEGLETAIAASMTHPQLYLGEIVRTEDGPPTAETAHTMDLRPMEESSTDLPLVPPPSAPRFVGDQRVEVHVDRLQLTDLWTKELSKGGLYVQSASPPAVGAKVEVCIECAAGEIRFNAQVVSVVPPERAATFQMPAGAGLQLTDLSGPKKTALKDFVEGHSPTLGHAPAPASGASEASVEQALDRARRLLARADEEALYAAIGLTAESTPPHIERALEELTETFRAAMPTAKPPQAARLQAALTVLDRIRRVLSHAEARLEYDFRAGHVRAQARILAATEGSGPDLATLRRVWNRVQSQNVDEAARLTRKAFAARQEHDLERAVRYGQRALEMNPFFDELRKTVDSWRRTQETNRRPAPHRVGPRGDRRP